VPVGDAPPDRVAVSDIDPPNTTDGDAWVVKVGAAMAETVVASALSFSGFGSVDELIVTIFVYSVPPAAFAGICPLRTKVVVVPAGMAGFEQVIVPPLPAFGVVQDHVGPEVWLRETNVMSRGRVSFIMALAVSGPEFIT
jgi:hypothetical protein